MTEQQYTRAKFWKCALQVNPWNYSLEYRNKDHGMTEEKYNQELLKFAKKNDIKVLGIADHGNVDAIDAIRKIMVENDILVFPGFEITSSEKAHFVCLFSEETTGQELNRYLGKLELLNPKNRLQVSNLSALELLKRVEEMKGFAFAAHCTDDSGVLDRKLNQVWTNSLLKAAQIPSTLEDLKNESRTNKYWKIIENKTREYQRELPIAIINAKDVAKPNDLNELKTSCLIKMTKPCFESFKLAFQDPESRVRLNTAIREKYYSRIESLKIIGGYLNDIHIDFSDHLNAVIGGRGTGKSTLLECIRYTLGLRPIGKNAEKQHDEIIKENIGKQKARVELVISSSEMNGKRFTIARRYGESVTVKDENNNISSFSPSDLLPKIEIYGQNEIYEIVREPSNVRQLLTRFLGAEYKDFDAVISEILKKLVDNRKKLIESQSKIALLEDEVARLPKLEERLHQFETLKLQEQLKIVPLLETEKRLLNRAKEESDNLGKAFSSIYDESLLDTLFLDEFALATLPHAESLRKVRTTLDVLCKDTKIMLEQWKKKYDTAMISIKETDCELMRNIQQEEIKLEKTFKELPALQGKSGKEIGLEFQALLKEIEQIRPKQIRIENCRKIISDFQLQRKSMIDNLSSIQAERAAYFEKSIKKLNRRLEGKLKLTLKPEADRTPLIEFLKNCKLDNIGDARLKWINETDDFSPVKLAELIRKGVNALQNANWGMTPTVAESLTRLMEEQILKLEEIELPYIITIELNTAHEGAANFRPLDKLSTGQQCTAILHLLLLDNLDPLIMDQPEDNLDNAFIAERIVVELRLAKIARQFIFATHNANIPVFGDAEWIGVFEVQEDKACMPLESQGAIDMPKVRDKSANILEGGRTAFNQRKAKYGF